MEVGGSQKFLGCIAWSMYRKETLPKKHWHLKVSYDLYYICFYTRRERGGREKIHKGDRG